MKPENGTSTGLLPARRPGNPVVPTLIRVPAVSSRSAATGRHAWPARPRRRRRLRREVRRTGAALMVGLVITLGLLPILGGRGSTPALSVAAPAQPVPDDFEPIVSLSASIEPSTPRDLGHHAVLPGIIEPDDGAEESTYGRN